MKKHISITLFILLLITLMNQRLCAQTKKASKFNSSFVSSKSLQLKDVPSLLTEARSVRNTDPAKALDIIKDALAISISDENHQYQAECYLLIGSINESIKEWDLAVENYDLTEEQLSLTGKGWQFSKLYYDLLYGRGTSYLHLNNYSKAEDNFNTIIKIRSDEKEKLNAQIELTEIQLLQKKEVKFKSSLGKSKKLSKELNGYKSKEINNLSYQWNVQNEVRVLADTLITQSNGTSITGNNSTDERIDRSNYYVDNNLLSEAVEEIEIAEKEISKVGTYDKKVELYTTQAKIYDKIGNRKKALEAYQKLDSERVKQSKEDKLFNTKKTEILKKQRSISNLSKDIILDEKQYEIEQRDQKIRQDTLKQQRLIIYGLLFIVILLCIGAYLILKNARQSKVANQLLALKSLRSQMNPHFIFNALNSVNHFVSKNDERAANKFLAEFSRLMRLVLEHSQEDFISLEIEKEILSLYIKLEHYRFRDKFEYQFIIDESIDLDANLIPPMLLQPYIENAIWHGLRYKDNKGELIVSISQENETIIVRISDNGIGRTASIKEKTKHQKQHKSVGLKNIQERLAILNKVYNLNYSTTLSDLDQENNSGTLVELKLSKKK